MHTAIGNNIGLLLGKATAEQVLAATERRIAGDTEAALLK